MPQADAGPPPADQIPDIPLLKALGNRRSIRYFDADRTVEDWKIETMLQAARFASCQGNINATEAIVIRKDTCDLWEEIEECVSGFNVQIINQASHLILWLTNLNAWYGRAVDGISTVSLAGATTKYHGWNYEFSMTQTIPRLMSFPTERTEMLLRFESGQATANAIAAGVGLDVGNILIAFGRKPGGIEKAFGLPPHYRFTWGHAVGYPLESPDAGGQRPRLKFEKLFHDNAFGTPLKSNPATVEMLKEKGLIQPQAPLEGRIEEITSIAERHGRDPGMLFFPAREITRLLADDDWDLGPRIRDYAQQVLETEDLPDYPDEMRETFKKLMAEHGIDAGKFLPDEG
jgi:nitroreductase